MNVEARGVWRAHTDRARFDTMTSDTPVSQAEDSASRPVLVRELDALISETTDRIEAGQAELRRLLRQINKDLFTYRNSIQLRNRFAHDRQEPEFEDVARTLHRIMRELERPSEGMPGQSSTAFSATGGRVATRRGPMPSDRLAQIRSVLRRTGGPMETGDIAAEMGRRGWLNDVADERATVSAALSRGARLGVLDRVSRGTYQLASPRNEQRRGPDGGDQGQPTPIASKEESDREDVPPSQGQ